MLAYDTKSLLQRAHVYRYKIHSDESFVQESPREVKKLMDMIDPLLIDFNNLNVSALY